ncbi:MAG: hypothetical protein PHW64_05550 [Sulfuricurvum sp.]|nr:hypothetical protein [Sulfuricurvum sp.]
MKPCRTFEELQTLGIEKIHERTHISRDKLERVLNKSFEEIGKVQFMGYISILEREYGLDLTEIKQEYSTYHQHTPKPGKEKASSILQSPTNSKTKWVIGGALFILMLMAGGYLLQNRMSVAPGDDVIKLPIPSIKIADDANDSLIIDTNESNTTSVETGIQNQESDLNGTQPLLLGKELVIHPTYKVWYGMINMATGERIQNITSEPIRIDITKDWLIFLGHGRVEVESSAGKTLFKEKETIRFICEKGVLRQITRDEFIERNGGKNW